MGRSGPSASQAGEVSTAGRRIGTRLSSTRDSLQKGPLNETRWSQFFRRSDEWVPSHKTLLLLRAYPGYRRMFSIAVGFCGEQTSLFRCTSSFFGEPHSEHPPTFWVGSEMILQAPVLGLVRTVDHIPTNARRRKRSANPPHWYDR